MAADARGHAADPARSSHKIIISVQCEDGNETGPNQAARLLIRAPALVLREYNG
jgi:hypothetical protein